MTRSKGDFVGDLEENHRHNFGVVDKLEKMLNENTRVIN